MDPSIDALFEELEGFCADSDRTTPRVFVGRRNELAELTLALKRTASAERPPRGMFRVVQGLPGAGKTALCERFLASIDGQPIGGRRAFGVQLHPSDLSRPPLELAMQVTEELPVGALRRHFRNVVSTGSQVADPKKSIFEMTNANHGLSRDSGLAACLNVYADRHWGENVAIALAFDEMQACPATEESIAALGALHEALPKSRIAVFCFGLQNTAAHLRENLKLSRLARAAEVPLGPLAGDLGRQLVERTLDALGVSAEATAWRRYLGLRGVDPIAWEIWRRRLVDEIDARAAGFPHHLASGLLATCETLRANRDQYGPDHDLLPTIVAALEQAKSTFYEQRLGDDLEVHVVALGAFCKDVLRRGEAWRTQAVSARPSGDWRRRRRRGSPGRGRAIACHRGRARRAAQANGRGRDVFRASRDSLHGGVLGGKVRRHAKGRQRDRFGTGGAVRLRRAPNESLAGLPLPQQQRVGDHADAR